MKLFLGALITIINLNTAYADILFLDLNNSPKEIEAAQKAAKQRGEKLIVFPDKSTDNSIDFTSRLSAKLQEMKNGSTQSKISSVILSGHNGNGHFTGSNASLSYVQLQRVIESNPELTDSVKSLYLWGCYTSTPGSIINNWKPAFKNLDVIIGYDGVAPANNSISGHKFLTDALIKEKKMSAAKTDKDLKSIFNDLAHVRNIDASICVSDTYVSKKKLVDLNMLIQQCDVTESKKWKEVYSCYMDGVKPKSSENKDLDCSDVPKNTNNSKLRDLYNYLQDTSHCDDIINSHGRDRERIIRLIFSKNVIKNFLENNKDCNNHINSFLEDSGSLLRIDVAEFVNFKRSEIKKKSSDISLEVRSKLKELEDKLNNNNLYLQKNNVDKMISGNIALNCATQLHNINYLNDRAIPFSWVEPSSNDKSTIVPIKEIRLQLERSAVQYIANSYAETEIRNAGLHNFMSPVDVKKLEGTILGQWNNKFNDKSIKEFQNQKSNLRKKYIREIEVAVEKIKYSIPKDADIRVEKEIIKNYINSSDIFDNYISNTVTELGRKRKISGNEEEYETEQERSGNRR